MANVDAAFGLRPVRHLNGTPYTGQGIRCYVSSLYATALFTGDPVDYDTTDANMDPTAKHPTVIIGTANSPILGVIQSIEPIRTDLYKSYIPASTGGYVNVCMDPTVIFQIQDNGGGTPLDEWPGTNATIVTGTGSTVTGLSGWELNGATPATTNTLDVHVLHLSNIETNELATYAIWDVMINNYRLANQIAGIL